MKKAWPYELSINLLVLLWTYTAFSKVLSMRLFIKTIGHSPFLKKFPVVAAGIIIGSEIVTAALLLFTRTRKAALISGAVLLTVFSFYILYMLLFEPTLPCSCGGVIQQLTWKGHLFFNGFFLLITILSLLYNKSIAQPGKAEHL